MGEVAYEVTFGSVSQPRSHVIVWLYAAQALPGRFTVAWRWIQYCGLWSRAGWDAGTAWFPSPEAADDTALEVAVGLACGEGDRFLGGHISALAWDGVPW